MTSSAEGAGNGDWRLGAFGAFLGGSGRTGRLLIVALIALVAWAAPWALVIWSNQQGFTALVKAVESGTAALHLGRETAAAQLSREHTDAIRALRDLTIELRTANCLDAPPDIRRRLNLCAHLEAPR